jgi:hypothetical protein
VFGISFILSCGEDNLNFTKWHILARHYVPTALTVCVRTGQLSSKLRFFARLSHLCHVPLHCSNDAGSVYFAEYYVGNFAQIC